MQDRAKTKYMNLFEPGYIGKVKIKNRIVRMGASPGFAPWEDGYMQQYYFDFYTALAKGGIGLITINVAPIGVSSNQLRGFSFGHDKYIPKIRALNDEIHKYGVPTFIQLFAIGPWMPPPDTRAASSIPLEEMPETDQCFPNAKELSIDDIKELVKTFGDYTVRAKKAGFDGVEVNAACTHLLTTFLSCAWNRRTDRYGFATMENRARIVVEIIKEIKKRNGDDFAVETLFNVSEPGLKNGITIEEAREFARIFEAAGADAIQARPQAFTIRKATGMKQSNLFPELEFYPEAPSWAEKIGADIKQHGKGAWTELAAEIKKVVKIPVITVGRLDADIGEKLLKSGKADFINMNRRLIADHDLPIKIAEGRMEDIAPCTACLTCWSVNETGNPISCRINANIGMREDYRVTPATKKKRVVVVGGGPAGMEAARVAALRGHNVTLLEKESMLGGSMNAAAVVKGTEREDFLAIIEYLKTQLKKGGVDVKLRKEATKETILALKPDTVVVATGGCHTIPDISGINTKKVLTSQVLHSSLKNYLKVAGVKLMTKLTTKYLPVGKKVAIIGGSIQGCQTAEFLTKRGRKVTIVEEGAEFGDGIPPILVKPQLLDWLDRKGTEMIAEAKPEAVTEKGLVVALKKGGQKTIEADTILTAMPLRPNTALFENLKDTTASVYVIGDAKQPGLIIDAIAAGYRVGREI